MRYGAIAVLAVVLLAGSSGCQPLHSGGRQPSGPFACRDGRCAMEGPYVHDALAGAPMEGPYACADGTPCPQPRQPRARGLLQAVGQLFHHGHRPVPPQGGPPIGTVTYPYYTVRGPRDFLASDPPSIGP